MSGRFMVVLGVISWRFGPDSWRFGFMEVWELGAPETAPPPGQTHTHSRVQDLENPKD